MRATALLGGAVAAAGLANTSGFIAQPAAPSISRIRQRCETCQCFYDDEQRTAVASIAGAVKQRRQRAHMLAAAAASTAEALVSLRLVSLIIIHYCKQRYYYAQCVDSTTICISHRDLEEYCRPWGVKLTVSKKLLFFKITATKVCSLTSC
jgi:hypothetical protein